VLEPRSAGSLTQRGRLRTYPVVERHGYVYFFNGPEPLFPLPFFWDEDPDEFVAGRIFRYVADCNWYMNASHAFDVQHFASVHDRELIEPPEIDYPAPFSRRIDYRARVVGQHLLDRLLRRFAGKTVRITISVCGGTIMPVTGDFGGVHSRFIVAAQPLENGQTLCEGICFARRTGIGVLDRINLAIRRVFTHGYLAAETRELRGTCYRPHSLGPNDQELIDYFRWVADLPQRSVSTTRNQTSEASHEDTAHDTVPPLPAARGAVAGARE
jgi:hypothetical protein